MPPSFPYAFGKCPVHSMICGLWGLNSLHSFRHLLLRRFTTPKEVCNTAVFKPTCTSTLALLPLIHCHKRWQKGSQSRPSSFLQDFFYYIQSPYSFPLNGLLRYRFLFICLLCELPLTSSSMLSFCRFDRNIRKRITCSNRADSIYNYSCLRSRRMMFPPALMTFLKLPRM